MEPVLQVKESLDLETIVEDKSEPLLLYSWE